MLLSCNNLFYNHGVIILSSRSPEFVPQSPLRAIWLLLAFMFWGIQLLLPVERGLPELRIFGAPLYIPLILNFIGFIIVFFSYPGWVVQQFSRPWLLLNSIFILWCGATSIFLVGWQLASFYSFFWASNYLMLYVIISVFYEKIGKSGIIFTTAMIIVIQIVIGALEAFADYKLPLFELARLNYMINMGAHVLGPRGTAWDLRVMGTLGDPILFGIGLVIAIPFLGQIQNKWTRGFLIITASLIAIMTLSRSIFLFLLLYIIWLFLFSVKKTKIILALTGCLFAGLILITDNPITANWSRRISDEAGSPSSGGIALRAEMNKSAISEVFIGSVDGEFIWGKGFYSSKELGAKYQEVSTTIDNSYLTILYENGMIGLMIYLLICIIPIVNHKNKIHSIEFWAYLGVLIMGFSFVGFRVMSINVHIISLIIALNYINNQKKMNIVFEK